MANMRKDDNNVYIDLWGETLEFNTNKRFRVPQKCSNSCPLSR